MASSEIHDKTASQVAAVHDTVGSKLLADAQSWFGGQNSTTKALEFAGVAAIGTAALAIAAKRLHTFEIIAKTTHLDAPLSQLERQMGFASKEYLDSAYVISPALKDTMSSLSSHLTQKFPELNSVVVAGGQANGSFVLRSMIKPHPGSDLDFYLVGHATTPQRLSEISKEVQFAVKANRLTLDGVLNGRNPEIYLNLSDLPHHIENQDYNLMALPFQAAYGKSLEAQREVLNAVMNHPAKDSLWQHIVEAHEQSLSMHHGTWTANFNNAVMHDYLPQKVKRFGLPKTPELALKQLTERTTDRP